MGRAFSLPSNGLPYLIGHALVSSDHVAICSPWLGDVDVRLPLTFDIDERRMKLAAAVRKLETTVDIYVRPDESSNDYALSRLSRVENVSVSTVPDLHAKAVITDIYVYAGSANITRGGLVTNKELCKVVENTYRDVQSYVEAELEV